MVDDDTRLRGLSRLEDSLSILWWLVFSQVSLSPSEEKLSNVVNFVVALSKRDDIVDADADGGVAKVYGSTVWQDMPMFGWEANSAWNSKSAEPVHPRLSCPELLTIMMKKSTLLTTLTHILCSPLGLNITSTDAQRRGRIESFLSTVRFVALLIKTRRHPFTPYKTQALWTFRCALEITTSRNEELDIWIPSVAILVDVIEAQLRESDEEFAPRRPGQGPSGKGGPLWEGRDGFSEERWQFWQLRLTQIGNDDNVDPGIRDMARQAGMQMTW